MRRGQFAWNPVAGWTSSRIELALNTGHPRQAEDKDGFEDEDGCPDPDNDKDHIPDALDKCPNDPETYNGFEDDDGCPDKGGRVIVFKHHVNLLDKVYFLKGKREVDPVSSPLLDAVAATLIGHPGITLVEMTGHAAANEARGSALAGARAAAVRDALIARNVPASRLVTRSYGSTQPVCSAKDETCASKNRRVEFVILSRTDELSLPAR